MQFPIVCVNVGSELLGNNRRQLGHLERTPAHVVSQMRFETKPHCQQRVTYLLDVALVWHTLAPPRNDWTLSVT